MSIQSYTGLLLVACCFAQGQKLSVGLVEAEMLEQHLRDFPLDNEKRQQRAKELFEKVNCPKIVLVPLGKKDYPSNVVCILPGENTRTILVGAHFDKVRPGEGKIDNATGVVLLSSLMRALQNSPRRHTFMFVAFAEEEVGLLGSAAMVKKGVDGLAGKEWIDSLSAMINIDSVGAGVTAIALSYSDQELANIAFSLARKLEIPVRAVNVDAVGMSDGSNFAKKKVRTVEFHSLDNTNFKVLHSILDTMDAFRSKEYSEAYRLLAFYLAQLDHYLDR